MGRTIVAALIAAIFLPLGQAAEDKTDSDAKRIASLAFKYAQRRQNDDGSYGPANSPLAVANTALVVHALATCSWKYRQKDGPFMSKAIVYLCKSQNDDGSFGAGASKAAQTLLAIRALLATEENAYAEPIAKAIAFAKGEIKIPDELRMSDMDLSVLRETLHDLWEGGGDLRSWAAPRADMALLALAWHLLAKAEAISPAIGLGLKHYLRVGMILIEKSPAADLNALRGAVAEIKAAQKQSGDADDDFGAIMVEDEKALAGDKTVNTVIAGRAADLVKTHYKKFAAALAGDSK